MAIVIELLDDGVVVDGHEMWWDDIEAALTTSTLDLPILARIDPFGVVELRGDDLQRLGRELDALVPAGIRADDMAALRRLAARSQNHNGSTLRFSGD